MQPGRSLRFMLALIVGLALAPLARAADLSIGIEVAPTSIDPHFHNFGPNKSLHGHVYEALVRRAPDSSLQAGLAESWRAVSPTVWEFRLRRGVAFHDGTPLTAADVLFSIQRVRTIQGSPSSYAFFVAPITEAVAVDAHTLRFTTAVPAPSLPAFMSQIFILSEQSAGGATTADFNAGRSAIGTGPYRFRSWTPGERVELTRNDGWWGESQPWERVTFRVISQGAARVAALLSGDVDLIAGVPPVQIGALRRDERFRVLTGTSPLLVTLFPDHVAREAPGVTDANGRPMPNPFTDVRVRRAASLALDRNAIAERVMDGLSAPTVQFMPAGYFGHLPDVGVPPANLAEARRLMAEAGHPEGFRLTIHCLNNRILNDVQICQAAAQMLQRIGMRATVEAMPQSVFVPRAQRFEFSLFMHGLSTELAEPASLLLPSVATTDRTRGRGAINRARYSNPAFDALLERALTTVDDAERGRILAEAQRILIDDVALIPIHHQVNAWASRRGVIQAPRADEFTQAMMVRPAP